MKILKLFSKFITNHSSTAYQIVVIAVPKGIDLLNVLKEEQFYEFEFIEEENIAKYEDEYRFKINISDTDKYDIYFSYRYSEHQHGFFESSLHYQYKEFEDYWKDWWDDAQKFVEHQGLKILYSKLDML